MKCMKDEEKKRLRPLIEGFKLGRGQNLERKKDFVKRKGLDRENMKRYQDV